MPELPEVETIVRELRKDLVGLRFKDAWADWPKTIQQAGGLENFNKQIKNKKILTVRRRAKYIVLDIEGKKTLFIHQKMSGHLLYGKWKFIDGKWQSQIKGPMYDDRNNQYIRVVMGLNNGYQLALSDLRRFGKIVLVDDDKVMDLKEIRELGPEPLEVSFVDFKKLFEKKKGRVKPVLMDPHFIVGIGNIYADEILWKVGLHPMSRVEHLDDKDLKKIYVAMQDILELAIKHKGSSMDDYRMPSGAKGNFQNLHNAYHRTGEKCRKKDGGVMERLKLAGRSGHFCPVHQVIK
ncbi:MAG: bifunctional DNA-formamidopyrimidine glycosylase/DNA-(apurinic or apyrimidinic site) lyase [Candidatus Pacebacteria bacterium]|nr:bifunctional DNA-formamidopyrimidine glycosylase/DNA-(apurinic or apyrimidinic site) lyase [Candidatus Paceibacterota bacterium]